MASASAAAGPSGSNQLPTETIALTSSIMQSFRPAKIIRSHITPGRQFTSLSYDDKGETLLTSADDGTIQVFTVRAGKHAKQLPSVKYGAHLARFTHTSSYAIYASTKENDDIRYLSVHDNKFVRYYKGHTNRVTSLEMSPVDDQFLSAAKDDTVRLWDLRSAPCQGCLNIPGHPAVAFDPAGQIFVVALQFKSTLLMYDMRNYDKAPFHSESINDPFSNNGKQILAATAGPIHYVLNSFTGEIEARLEGHIGMEKHGAPNADSIAPATRVGISGEEACWSPDSRYVLSGTPEGNVCVWDVNPPEGSPEALAKPAPAMDTTLQPMAKIDCHSGGPARCVNFNPRLGMFASAGLDLALWLPDETLDQGA